MKKLIVALTISMLILSNVSFGQIDSVSTPITAPIPEPQKENSKKKWYETLSLKGYSQIRYNRLLETNKNLKCDQCDKSIGDKGGIFFRRARLTLSGDIHERFSIYIQTDVATTVDKTLNFLQLRDFYGDIYLTNDKTLRFRLGLSKVPFGFDVLQSSSNRATFDRSDAINSAAYNERDMGAFLYYAPTKVRELFKKLQNAQLKGTGDYGMFGIGIYDGQTASKVSNNNDLHSVVRFTYPFELRSQIFEISTQAYSGKYNVKDIIKDKLVTTPNSFGDVVDQRIGASFIIYPKPIGFQAEYNWGEGPTFTKSITNTYSIERKHLEGGYAQLSGAINIGKTLFSPFVRYQYYKGGKKNEQDARFHEVRETEAGIEWQASKYLEITAAYMISDRVFEDSSNPINHQYGNLLRLQVQFNY